jgi:hypothetical protein
MTKEQEALKLAQIALDDIEHQRFSWRRFDALVAIKQALAQPAQEPVAWVHEHELPLAPGDAFSWVETFVHKKPLYTSPPAQHTWVGLTDEEVIEISHLALTRVQAVQMTEAKLKEKNT